MFFCVTLSYLVLATQPNHPLPSSSQLATPNPRLLPTHLPHARPCAQTFPSLKATARLAEILGEHVYVMVGGEEGNMMYTEMGRVVCDYHRTKQQQQQQRDGNYSQDSHDEAELAGGTHQRLKKSFTTRKTLSPAGGGVLRSAEKLPGTDHIFCNLSGPRPAEPSSAAVCASHATLTELLMFMIRSVS